MTTSSGDGESGKNAQNLNGPDEEQLARIKVFDAMFKVIRDATGVSDAQKMVKRFEAQDETKEHLSQLKTEAETQIETLKMDRNRLREDLEAYRYDGEAELTRSVFVKAMEKNWNCNIDTILVKFYYGP